MSKQPSLFELTPTEPAAHYPDVAGWKNTGTSQDAAESIDASTLRASVRACLHAHGSMTADECALRLGQSVLAIRPRFSELRALGSIVDTGTRRFNQSGKAASVWRLA